MLSGDTGAGSLALVTTPLTRPNIIALSALCPLVTVHKYYSVEESESPGLGYLE